MDPMVKGVVRNWGLMALRGVVALLCGSLTLFTPIESVVSLLVVFGAYALTYGVFTIVAAVANRSGEPPWVAPLVSGIQSVVLGMLALLVSDVTARMLLYFAAAWAIATGVADIVAAVRLRKVITGEWLLVVAGVLSVLFGLVTVTVPTLGTVAPGRWIGMYATVLGALLTALGFRLRSWGRAHDTEPSPSTA